MNTINSFNQGMKSGIDASLFPPGSYRYMRNGHLFSKDEHGFVVTNISAPTVVFSLTDGFLPVGSCEYNGKLYIVSYNALFKVDGVETPMIEFGEYSNHDGVYSYLPFMTLDNNGERKPLRIRKSIIGYSTDKLIEVFPRKSFDSSINLYICDGLNTNIVVNDAMIYDENTLSIHNFSQFKSIGILPTISGVVSYGGYLKPGSYFVAVRFTTKDLNSTMFFNQIGPFIISDGTNEKDFKGLINEDEVANRCIEISVDDIPDEYSYYELVVMHYFGENDAKSYDIYKIDAKISSNKFVISGIEEKINMTIEELLKNNIQYSSCKSHLQLNGMYYGANWNTSKSRNEHLDKLASLIVPEYVLKDDDSVMVSNALKRNYGSMNSNSEMKYKAGEIYPFAVSFIIDGKYMSDAYPIAGYDSNQDSYSNVLDNVSSGAYINNKGLFRFPFAKAGTLFDDNNQLRKRLYYNMIGVRFHFDVFNNEKSNYDINITGVVIRQGSRIVNCMSQGINVPLIDRVVVSAPEKYISAYSNRYGSRNHAFASEIISLGDGLTPVYFPYLFKNVKSQNSGVFEESYSSTEENFSFPVIFMRGNNDFIEGQHHYLGYVSPYYNLTNFTKEEYNGFINGVGKVVSSSLREHFLYSYADNFNSVIDNSNILLANKMESIRAFGYMSPDDTYGKFSDINGYIRTLRNMPRSSSYIKTTDSYNKSAHSVAHPKIDGVNGIFFKKPVITVITNVTGDESSANNFSRQYIAKEQVSMKYVDKNTITPLDEGYISEMKSIFQVFGEFNFNDQSMHDDYDKEYYKVNIAGKSRKQLSAAGIHLNNFLFHVGSQNEGWIYADGKQFFGKDDDGENSRIFDGYFYADGYFPSPFTKLAPRFITNIAIRSRSYYGFKTESNVLNRPYSDFISEVYLKDPDSNDVYEFYRERYNPFSEKYSEIKTLSSVPGVTENIYKGDVFAQVVTFRLNRYTYDTKNAGQYTDDWRHGQVATLYLESFKNHALRCASNNDVFYPYAESLGNNIYDFAFNNDSERFSNETETYNEGYHERQGMLVVNGVDPSIPVQSTNKPNRIYYSELYVDGAIEDAYRNINIGSYKDFNPENGEIHKIISHGNYVFIVQDKGISQLYLSNSQQQLDGSYTIISGDTDNLNPFTKELATYGTQHKSSIVVGEAGIYGVDWRQKKIWMISLKVSDRGSYFYLCEDLIETKSLRLFFNDLEGGTHKDLGDNLFNENPIGIISGYNTDTGEVYFTFHLEDKVDTLVYDEKQKLFVGYNDYTPSIYLHYRNILFMVNRNKKSIEPFEIDSNVYQPETSDSCDNFFNVDNESDNNRFELEFYVNGLTSNGNLSDVQKEFIVHKLFASDNLLKIDSLLDWVRKIEWTTEYQGSSLNLSGKNNGDNDSNYFWKTPIFDNHVWTIPIDVQSTESVGPGDDRYYLFERGSTLRGSWLKVKISYSGKEKIFIKNCVTEFINSF